MVQKGSFLSQRYELLTFLGKGGMSEVWKARHIHLDKFVAVKLLKKDLTEKVEFVARFRQEAQIASKLNHENICGVSDFGFTEDEIPFIVMEYLEGESLAAVLKRIERLPVGASLSIIRQTVSGLKAAHKIGVVHRDIKPGNIFITKEKSGHRTVKILDFGISKMVSGDKGELGLTTTGTLLGTAFYLSPEQIMESRGVDQRTDIYASGAVLYKMITGKVPYMGENFGEVAVKVVNDPLVDPRDMVKGLANNVSKTIRKSMEKDPRSRFQSSSDMLAELDKLMEDYHGDTIDALYKPGLESLILKPQEKKPSRFGRKLKIATIGTSLSVIVGAIILLILFTMNHLGTGADSQEGEENNPDVALQENEGNPNSKVKPSESKEGEEPLSETVNIRFNPMTPGSKIRVGDEEFTGDLLQLDRSSTSLKIIIFAEGYHEKEITLVPNSDMQIDASLQRIPEKPPEVAAGSKKWPKGKPTKKTKKTGTTKPSTEDKEKKKGMDFVRDFPG